jgi:hypothetical protein
MPRQVAFLIPQSRVSLRVFGKAIWSNVSLAQALPTEMHGDARDTQRFRIENEVAVKALGTIAKAVEKITAS